MKFSREDIQRALGRMLIVWIGIFIFFGISLILDGLAADILAVFMFICASGVSVIIGGLLQVSKEFQ